MLDFRQSLFTKLSLFSLSKRLLLPEIVMDRMQSLVGAAGEALGLLQSPLETPLGLKVLVFIL